MKTTTRKTARRSTFTPAAWQWDPASLTATTPEDSRVQFWTAGGSMTLVSMEEARGLVAARAAFCGSVLHICQVHDGIDGCNAR